MQATTTYPAIVGGVLSSLRKQRELKQTELGQALQISQAGVSKIERGETAITVEQLAVACALLETSPGRVLEQADDVVAHARRSGVRVENRRPRGGATIAIIGSSSLSALITQANDASK